MRRLRRGEPFAQFTGNYRRSLWNPHRTGIPGSELLYGPARGTYWLQDGEVHLLYEARDKQPVHYAGPLPPKQMAPVLFYLWLLWPFVVTAAALVVALEAHLTSGRSALGLAIAAPAVLALLLLLFGQVLRRRHRKRSEPIAPAARSAHPGRVVALDVPLPQAVRAATSSPPRSPRDALKTARKAAGGALLVALLLLLVATLVLDPAADYDDDVWAVSAVIVGVCGITLMVFSGITLVALSLAITRDKERRNHH